MAAGIPAVPASFKPLQHHIKTAAEHDARDPVVAYYCKPFQRVVVKLDDLTVGAVISKGGAAFYLPLLVTVEGQILKRVGWPITGS